MEAKLDTLYAMFILQGEMATTAGLRRPIVDDTFFLNFLGSSNCHGHESYFFCNNAANL